MSKVISVDNLIKKYGQSDTNAVDGISFDVDSGEFFALLGPNGAGKTTTISILTTTLSGTSGKVVVCGHDVSTNPSGVRSGSGIIFQNRSLDENLTAEENVRLHSILYGMYGFRLNFGSMPKDYKDRINNLASILGIEGEMHKPIKGFSGGMKRKLEIVRGLIHEPDILFLDEPTTGLDPESRRNLWDYLAEVQQSTDVTVFLTTHYLEEAEGADRVCIIDKGRIVAIGTPDQVKSDMQIDYLVVDCNDREGLIREIDARGIKYDIDEKISIHIERERVHKFLKEINTDITFVESRHGTLEDAYLKIVSGGV